MSFTALLVGIALVGVFQIALIWIIKCPSKRQSRHKEAIDCEQAIRQGKWRKYMDGKP